MEYLEQIINGELIKPTLVVSNLEYLYIPETLRKYPPAPSVGRDSKTDYKIPGTDKIFEKKLQVSIPIYAIHHDAKIYPDPEKFDPDRFAPKEVAKRHPCSFLPFGDGPRVCIGLRFAMTEAKFALTKLLMNFSFTFDSENTPEILKPNLNKGLLQPSTPVYIKIKKL
jgi:cytochrome P450